MVKIWWYNLTTTISQSVIAPRFLLDRSRKVDNNLHYYRHILQHTGTEIHTFRYYISIIFTDSVVVHSHLVAHIDDVPSVQDEKQNNAYHVILI